MKLSQLNFKNIDKIELYNPDGVNLCSDHFEVNSDDEEYDGHTPPTIYLYCPFSVKSFKLDTECEVSENVITIGKYKLHCFELKPANLLGN